jgi:hypothetical protein
MVESSSETVLGAQLAILFGIIIVLVVTGCVAGGRSFNNINEPFTPLEYVTETFTKSSPSKETVRRDNLPITTDRVPHFANQLPVGHLSTMGSPLFGQASCTSNINGVQKLGSSNPYGELVKNYGNQQNINQFTQSYAACEFGTNNVFDVDQLQY